MSLKPIWIQYVENMPKLSLRNRFALGLGAMLMPFFILVASSFISFERTITSFERAENSTLEKRFPLAELKQSFGQARPTIDSILIEPGQRDRINVLNELNSSISRQIKKLLNPKMQTPEQYGLLMGIEKSWQQVYASTLQYPQPLKESEAEPMTRSEIVDQIHEELDEALNGVDRIEILIAHIQTSDNLKLARSLKRQQRYFISMASLIAVTLALLSALLLSRSVLNSMQILIKGLERLSEGNLDKRIEWSNDDEFGRLARAINHMAEKLAQSQQALIEIATLDGLTGVYNRREFNRLLTIEVEKSRRDSAPVSMVMVDIDHFKSINDTYGHQSGDDALRWVSALLRQEIRPGDIAARYGGEEFALILPNTRAEEAAGVAERIRARMEREEVPIQNYPPISVTASLGCATFPYIGDSEELLMNAADKALYRAKETGRNRVCHAQMNTASLPQNIQQLQKKLPTPKNAPIV